VEEFDVKFRLNAGNTEVGGKLGVSDGPAFIVSIHCLITDLPTRKGANAMSTPLRLSGRLS
jgi:hypothetical protein